MKSDIPFCKDCAHFRANDVMMNEHHKIAEGYCALATNLNYVTGKTEMYHANTNRSLGQPCGPDGKLFTPKY